MKKPITNHKDIEYIDLVIALEEITSKIEKVKSRRYLFSAILLSFFLNLIGSFVVVYYFDTLKGYSEDNKKSSIFIERFNNLSKDDKIKIITVLKKGA